MMKFMIFCFFWFGINRIDEPNAIFLIPAVIFRIDISIIYPTDYYSYS